MHKHDQDLIAAIAEGTLDAESAAAAAAGLEGCAICSADLKAQQAAIAAIATAPPVAMTAAESAGLRTAVADAIGMQLSPSPVAAPRSRRTPWGAIAVAAASLAGIIAVVPALGLLSGGSDDASTAATSAVAFDAAEDEASAQTREVGALEEAAGFDDAETASAAPTEPTVIADTTTATAEAIATTTVPAAAAVTEQSSTSTGEPGTGETPEGANLTADNEAEIKDLFDAGPVAGYTAPTEQDDRAGLACSAEAEQQFGNEYIYIDLPAGLDDGRKVVLYAAADWSVLAAFDLADCSLVLTLP